MEILSKALEILSLLTKASNEITERPVFKIKAESVGAVKKYINDNNLEISDDLADNEIELSKCFYEDYNITAYSDISSFFRRFKITDFGQQNIVILNVVNDDLVVFGGSPVPSAYCYPSMADELKTVNYYYLLKIVEEFFPKFVDYIDNANQKLIFLSPDCGRFEIDKNNLSDIADTEKPFSATYKKIENIVSMSKGWEYILKNRIINKLEIIDNKNDRFRCLFENMDNFIDITLKDFELFMISKKHETIINQFENERDNFAEKIRTVLERIATSLLSIPISFSAALLGFKDLNKNDTWLINVFLLSLGIFVIFSCIIQCFFINELTSIRKEIYAKSDNFSLGISFLKTKFHEISKPLLVKIKLLQILCVFIIVAFIVLYILLAINYLDIKVIFDKIISIVEPDVK
jgi:hypothetical protein